MSGKDAWGEWDQHRRELEKDSAAAVRVARLADDALSKLKKRRVRTPEQATELGKQMDRAKSALSFANDQARQAATRLRNHKRNEPKR